VRSVCRYRRQGFDLVGVWPRLQSGSARRAAGLAAEKVAVTVEAARTGTTQVVLPVHAPDQPANTDCEPGSAVRRRRVPLSTVYVQLGGQRMPVGELVTVPLLPRHAGRRHGARPGRRRSRPRSGLRPSSPRRDRLNTHRSSPRIGIRLRRPPSTSRPTPGPRTTSTRADTRPPAGRSSPGRSASVAPAQNATCRMRVTTSTPGPTVGAAGPGDNPR
jgi:hypothetical protein